jgi:hypothetical protein
MNIKFKTYKKILLITSLLLLFFGINQVDAQTTNSPFYRNLTIGDVGPDVLLLQKFLNTDFVTVVAQSGVGSVGNETNYFGNLTKDAVTRFQNKYRDEVLTPIGLFNGTGYFGKMTRAKANQLFSSSFELESGASATEVAQELNNILNQQNNNDINSDVSNNETDSDFQFTFTQSENNNQNNFTEPITEYNQLFGLPTEEEQQKKQEELLQQQFETQNSSGIYYINRNPIKTGQSVSIIAHGLNNNSKLFISGYGIDYEVSNLNIKNDSNAEFRIPRVIGGKYNLFIENNGVKSDPFVIHIYQDFDSVSSGWDNWFDLVKPALNIESRLFFVSGDNQYQLIINDVDSNSFEIPSTPAGNYGVVIENNNERFSTFPVRIYRTNTRYFFNRNLEISWNTGSVLVDYNPPRISGVSNQPIVYGDTVTISGSNFTDNNKIITPLGTFENITAENSKEIKLKIEKPSFMNESTAEPYFESFIEIYNNEGRSNKYDVEFGDKADGLLEENIKNENDKVSNNTNSNDGSGVVSDIATGVVTDVATDLISSGANALTDKALDAVTGAGSVTTFGGHFLSVIPCTCSFNLLTTVFDYKTNSVLPLIYQPGVSKLLSGTPVGFNQLGTYSPGGVCLQYAGFGCYGMPAVGISGGLPPGYGTSN